MFPKTKPGKKEVALYAQNMHGILSLIVKIRLGGSHLYEDVDENFKERSDNRHHMLGTQISPIQGFSS